MHVRAYAMAILLVSGTGIACTHSRSERSTETASASERSQSMSAADANSPATESQPSRQGQPSTVSESPDSSTDIGTTGRRTGSPGASDQGSASTSSSATGAAPSPGTGTAPTSPSSPDSSTTATAPSSPPSPDSATTAPDATAGSPGSSAGGSYGTGGATASDEPIRGHSDDSVVSGKIARVTRRALVVQADDGDRKSLAIVPETTIEVDGHDARRTDLEQGQDVRASFNQVDGRDVAVTIRANRAGSSSSSGLHGSGSMGGTGSVEPGDADAGASPSEPDRPDAGGGPSKDDPSHAQPGAR